MSATEARLTAIVSNQLDAEYWTPANYVRPPWPLAVRIAQAILDSGLLHEIEEQGIERGMSATEYHKPFSHYPEGKAS